MFGLVTFIQYPEDQDPRLQEFELFRTFEEAKERSDALLDAYEEEYGEDYHQRATEIKPLAFAGNGDVIWRAYIKETDDPEGAE